MSPKKRNKENRGLPSRWRFRNGTYSYMVPKGQERAWDGKSEFKLGRNLAQAYRTWADRMEVEESISTFSQLCERYQLEHLPGTSYSNQEQGLIAVKRLLPVFGKMRCQDIEPSHAYRYFDIQKKVTSEHSAKSDVAHLKTMLSCAVRWGFMNNNPLLKNVMIRVNSAGRKSRYIHDWEVDEMLAIDATARGVRIIQPYIRLKLLTGLRRIDLLRMRLADMQEDGIHVTPSKTLKSSGRRLIFIWNEPLRDVVRDIQRLPPRRVGDVPLFVNRKGEGYINANGQARSFNSIWQRFVAKVLTDTAVTEHFMEKDLRAKVGSDSKTDEDAARILGHTNTTTTRKHYRLLPEVIELD